MSKFDRLVRFTATDGQTCYGELGASPAPRDLVGKTVPVFSGLNPWDEDFVLNGKEATIKEVSVTDKKPSKTSQLLDQELIIS